MSKVVSLRLKDDQVERLQRMARRLGRKPSVAAALLLEEALRESEFAFVDFRDTVVGRQAFLKGTRLKVWQVAWLARHYSGDTKRLATDLEIPEVQILGALQYAQAYPTEIEDAIADNNKSVEELRRLIPNLQVFHGGSDTPLPSKGR